MERLVRGDAYGWSADPVSDKVHVNLNTIRDLNERNTVGHTVLFAVEGHLTLDGAALAVA